MCAFFVGILGDQQGKSVLMVIQGSFEIGSFYSYSKVGNSSTHVFLFFSIVSTFHFIAWHDAIMTLCITYFHYVIYFFCLAWTTIIDLEN